LGLNLNDKVKSLSGGNKRKLSIALAILGPTKIIYMDEPTSSIDP
jgi:ABC-type multidrug transport system ATPase subunit